MKFIRCITLFSLSCMWVGAKALPVLNQNVSGAQTLTVFPDHEDADLFYIAPNSLQIAKDPATQTPQFSYLEIGSMFTTRAAVQTLLAPYYSNLVELDTVRETVRAAHPSARFSALPFLESKVVFTETLSALMEKNECNHVAGLVGDAQSCTFLLNSKGRKIFRTMLREGAAITVQLEYQVQGVVENAQGQYIDDQNTYRISGVIGSQELKKYPELFRDSKGRVIRFDKEFEFEE